MHQASSILLLIIRFTVLLSTWALPDNDHPDLPWLPVRLAMLERDDLLAAGHVLLHSLTHLRCSQQRWGWESYIICGMRLCLPKLIVYPVFLKSTEVLYRRWTVHAVHEFGERSGRKRVRTPEGMVKAQGRKREGNRPHSRKARSAQGES